MSTSSTSIAASKKSGLGGLYSLFCKAAHLLRSPFLLFVRLYWGWQFMQTGWGKLHNLSHVRDFFASLGIPLPGLMAPAIASLEFFGGILLIVGLGTRLIGLLLAGNMFVAYLTSERMALTSIFSDPGKFYVADPFTFLFASLIAFILGAGLFSLDALITRRSQINV
ncbi:MAG TPA: DoxX family protein [Silvibacterium sp.]|jgi:putative oxidoreductase|nr:DoxX family protein [Silvibacterium sp.]